MIRFLWGFLQGFERGSVRVLGVVRLKDFSIGT